MTAIDVIKTTVFKVVPALELKKGILCSRPGQISRKINPASTRLILGATALMAQPFIDLNNQGVEEKTRRVSAAKTIAKIVVGTATGFLIRSACIKAIEKLSENSGQLFSPGIKGVTAESLPHYRSAMGTFVALGIMLFTNFLIDAPLTQLLTNKLIKKDAGGNGAG